ncbi:ribonuclease H-like domain-containing protein [Tanacetum coccineum]
MSTHPMVTRAKAGIFKPLERMNCHVTTTSPLPRSHVHALRDPHWKEAMLDEYNALISNGTWALVPLQLTYKARLVANRRSQQQGIDCDETFSLVVKPATIRTVLSLAVSPGPFMALIKLHVLGVQRFAIMLHTSSSAFLQRIITSLHSEFAMTDLEEILERAHMQNCNPCRTPIDTESKLGSDGDPVSNPTLYRSLAGALQYLTFTRPDLSYAVQQRAFGTVMIMGLQLLMIITTQLTAYTDADWAGCPVTRRSTSGYCVFLGDNLLSWSAKRQVTLSRSSAEAEYRGVANVVAETAWIRNLLCELHTPLFTATLVYCDNVSAVYMSANPVQHQRTKHIEIDIHFVRDFVASGQVRVLHVPSRFQYAYIFTKGLPTALFIEFPL